MVAFRWVANTETLLRNGHDSNWGPLSEFDLSEYEYEL